MKRFFRLTALILALLMLVNISASATTDGIPVENLKMADWSNMLQSASQAAQVSEDAETIEVDEVGTYYWGYITTEKYFNSTAAVGGYLGKIPAYSFVKVYDEAVGGGLYKVGYAGQIGYVSAYSSIPACECQNSMQDDPATHSDACVYPTAFMTLANDYDAAGLLAMWLSFSTGERAFVLDYLKANMPDKYAAVSKLENVNKTELNITSNGGDENAPSVNAAIKVPEGAFEEDYIMNAAASVLNDQQQQALNTLQLWRQLAVFDISFDSLADGSKLQPSVPVQLTFTVDVSNIHGNTLHVHHLKDNGDGTYTAESLGTVAVDKSQTTQTIAVNCPSFSAITVSDECDGSICCMYNDEITFSYHTLMAQPSAEERWNYLNERYEAVTEAADETAAADAMATFMAHLGEVHSDCLSQLCQCGTYPIPAVGDASHAADCPWSAANQQNTHVFEGTDGNGQFFDPDTDMSIYVPDDAFTNNAYTVQATPVFALDEAQQEAVAALDNTHVFAAFDVSFLGSDGATAPATPVDLTFVVNSTGNLVGSHLVIHCLQKSGDDTYTVRKLGETELDYQAASLIASAQCSVFPGIITLSYACDGSACGFNTIMNAANAAEREAALRSLVENDEYYIFTMCAETFHYDETNSDGKTINDLICLCYGYPDDPDGYAYGSLNHETECYKYGQDLDDYTTVPCPWHFNQISPEDQLIVFETMTEADKLTAFPMMDVENQATVLADPDMTDAEREEYVGTLSPEQKDELFNYVVENDMENSEAIVLEQDGVTVNAPIGAFPSGTTANVTVVTDETVMAALADAIAEGDGIGSIFGAYDFSFEYTALGMTNKVQPNGMVELNFAVSQEDAYAVYHMVENESGGYTAEMVGFSIVEDGELSVEVDEFSIYTVTRVGATSGKRLTSETSYTFPMNIGDPTVIFYTNNGNGSGEWRVTDTAGVISYSVDANNNSTSNNFTARWISVTPKNTGTATLTFVTSNGTQATVTITVSAPEGFYVDDQVADNGCLVPAGLTIAEGTEVTYSWTRSDGQSIRSSALNTDGSVNISLDRGGVTNSRDPITYTVVASVVGENGTATELGSASYEVLYGNEILNNSFETPTVGDGAYIYNGYPGLYWKTTAPGTGSHITQDIEILTTRNSGTLGQYFGTNTAAHGTQFVELNAEAIGTLYQDILTTPGSTLTWQFSHAARTTPNDSNNKMFIVVAATKDAQDIINANNISTLLSSLNVNNMPTSGDGYRLEKDGEVYYVWGHDAGSTANVWTNVSGSYEIPEGQYLTRLFFASDPNSSSSTCGNLIDYTSAGEHMSYAILYYPDGEVASNKTETGNGTVYTTVTPENLQEYIDDGYIVTGVMINGSNYSGSIDNLLYITEYQTASDYTAPSGFADTSIVAQITLRKKAITVTKNVEIEGWDKLTEDQRKALFASAYTANFELYKGDSKVATAAANITYAAEGQKLTALAEFVVDNGDSYTPDYANYTVKETATSSITGYALDGAPTYAPASVTLSQDNPTANVTVTNKYKVTNGSLSITKNVTDATFTTGTFNFTVTPPQGVELPALSSVSGVTVTDNVASVALNITSGNTASVTLPDLPAGDYTVQETGATNYNTTVAVGTAEAAAGTSASVNVPAGEESKVTFTNTRKLGDLKIAKTVVGEYAPAEDFTISVTLTGAGNATYAYKVFDAANTEVSNGSIGGTLNTITLKDGQYALVEGIPQGATYKVEETNVDSIFSVSYTGQEGTISETTVAEAVVTNTHQVGSLTINKTVTDDSVEDGQRFLFKVTNAEGKQVAEVVLAAGGSITLDNLPIGEYTVTEDTNWSARYTVEGGAVKTDAVTVNGHTQFSFKNTKANDQWLDANAGVQNDFEANTEQTY